MPTGYAFSNMDEITLSRPVCRSSVDDLSCAWHRPIAIPCSPGLSNGKMAK